MYINILLRRNVYIFFPFNNQFPPRIETRFVLETSHDLESKQNHYCGHEWILLIFLSKTVLWNIVSLFFLENPFKGLNVILIESNAGSEFNAGNEARTPNGLEGEFNACTHKFACEPNGVLSQSSAYYMPTTAEILTFFKSSSFGPARQDVLRKKQIIIEPWIGWNLSLLLMCFFPTNGVLMSVNCNFCLYQPPSTWQARGFHRHFGRSTLTSGKPKLGLHGTSSKGS